MGVHRPRHRRRQRLRRAGRLRAHHSRRARPDQERGGAGRRARPRDHARHREAHGQRDPEEQARVSSAPTRSAQGLAGAGSSSPDRASRPTATSSTTSSTATTRTRPTRSASRLANKVGYAPAGLGTFLTKLADATRTQTGAERLVRVAPADQGAHRRTSSKPIKEQKLTATATVAARYAKTHHLRRQAAGRDCDGRRGLARPGRRRRRQEGRREEGRRTKKEEDRRRAAAARQDRLEPAATRRRARRPSHRPAREDGDPDRDAEGRSEPEQGARHDQPRPSSTRSRRASRSASRMAVACYHILAPDRGRRRTGGDARDHRA